MSYLEHPDILEKIIIFLEAFDRYNLMETCRTIRDIIGKSDVWKRTPKGDIITCKDNTKIEVMFKLFMSIRLSKRTFAIQDYYGDWYYLYTMHVWFVADCQTNWGLYSLLSPNGIADIEKMIKICEFLSLELETKEYRDWSLMMPKLAKKLDFDPSFYNLDANRILKFIYLTTYWYEYEDQLGVITITNTKIKSNPIYPGFVWYPIESIGGTIAPEHFCYRFCFRYASNTEFCAFSKNGKKFQIIYSSDFLRKIQKISVKLNVGYKTLFEIVRIVLGKTIPQCEQRIHEFMNW